MVLKKNPIHPYEMMIFIFHIVTYVMTFFQMSPWLWKESVFRFHPIYTEHNKCLNILHGFSEEMIRGAIHNFSRIILNSDS
jgi:hypothetical protein